MKHLSYVAGFVCLASPLFAVDWNVAAGGDFQAALNSAEPGDTITLQGGATYQGTYTLPNKAGANWITIRSSKLSALPPDGVRVTPADALNMPKLMAFTSNPVVMTSPGAHHFRFVGIEFIPQPGVYNYSLIYFGIAESNIADVPQYLELDRVYMHGDPEVGTKRAITLNSKDAVIKNSWISQIASTYQEAQAIQGWNGPGPYSIVNNYLEASSIGILFGGATPAISGMVPSDIQILRNYFYKPLSWRKGAPEYAGKPWWIKNHLEIKNGQRITIDGNVFENSWEDQQGGIALLFMPANEGGTAPWVVAQDITVSNNIIRHAGNGLAVSGCDGTSCGGRRVTIKNNLFDDIDGTKWGSYGRLYTFLNKTDAITVTHNTGFQSGHIMFSDGMVPNTGLVFQNNIAAHNAWGIYGSGYGTGTGGLNYYFPGSIVTANVMTSGPAALYPSGNFFPASMHDVGFVNLGAGDFHLGASSRYKNAGSDGRDVGVDYDALLAATANTVGGNSFAAPAPPPVFGATGTAAFVKTDTGSQGNWQGVYGANGYDIPGVGSTIPNAARLSFREQGTWVWNPSTTELKALVNPVSGSRTASEYFGPSWFTISLNLDTPQQLAVYCLDYDNLQRAQVVDVVDRRTGTVLDSRSVTDFQNGKFLVWNVSGDIVVQVSSTSPNAGAAVSGIFLGAPSTAPAPPPPPSGGTAAAVFQTADNTTQGAWRNAYGAGGYQIAYDGTSIPTYAQMSMQGQSSWQYAGSTTDVRALQKAANANDRVSAVWYASTKISVDLNLTDGQPHTVAFYIADYDQNSRAESIAVVDAVTGAVLSTRSESGFAGGRYLVWTLSGHVRVDFTRTSGPNVVFSGIFFDTIPGASGSSATAVFQSADNATQGSWRSAYGSGGYQIASDGTSIPTYAQLTMQGQSLWQYAASTTDVRALQKAANANDRVLAVWYANAKLSVDLNLTDGQAHTVAFYIADYDQNNRAETVQIMDAATGTVLSTRSESAFSGGRYLVWQLRGHVRVEFTRTGGPNVVLSGMFFDTTSTGGAIAATAVFQTADNTRQGSWLGIYGSGGYQIAYDGTSIPAYAQVTLQGATGWQYAASTSDVRGLQKSANPNDRVLAVWYASTKFTVDLNLSDTQVHTVAFYIADYDQGGRAQTIQVLDATSGAVLSTRTESAFSGGRYLVWNLSGHVRVEFTKTAGPNALLSGIFFGTP